MIHHRPVEAVLFDFHGTLAQVEPPVRWVRRAAAACGVQLDEARATALADVFLIAGRAGGPPPAKLPPALAEVYADRDLSPQAHRAAYTGLADTVPHGIEGLATALYERLLIPDGWQTYPDTVPTLRELRRRGVPVAVVSNIGFDIRPLCEAFGFADLVDAWVLSYEVGTCKPDVAIFQYACDRLGVAPHRALMVGDSRADAAAAEAGCEVLILPASPPGSPHGLGGVLRLLGPSEVS